MGLKQITKILSGSLITVFLLLSVSPLVFSVCADTETNSSIVADEATAMLFIVADGSIIKEKTDTLVGSDGILLFHNYKYLRIEYVSVNSSLSFTREKQIGTFLQLRLIPEGDLSIFSPDGLMIFHTITHENTFENILKYRFGVGSDDPTTSRINTVIAFIVALILVALCCWFILLPYLNNRIKRVV